MALARTQREWAILVGEYNICKKKLESKREALKIITKEWQSSKRECELHKNKVNQLQQDLEKYINQRENPEQEHQQEKPPERVKSPDLVTIHTSTSKDTLAQLVHEYKQANKALRHDFQELKKLYIESQEDVQLMRERMRRQSSSSSNHGDDTSDSVTDEKEECILQLEEYKEQLANLEREIKSVKDENSDIMSERDFYKEKCERLNTQLNYILGADDRRLVDVDALVLDNKYLKEKLTLLEEERNLEKESIQKYEAAFEKKKNKILRPENGRRLASYHSKHNNDHSLKTVADLRNVANILSEAITEKNLALSHQRNANRILGKRVSELENKLKTLEVAGLWSLPGHRGYGSASLESNGFDMHSKYEEHSSSGVKHLPATHARESSGKPCTSDEKLESKENTMLVKLNDEDALGNQREINGNEESYDCRNERERSCSHFLPSSEYVSPSNLHCDVCRLQNSAPEKHPNNLTQPCRNCPAASLWDERCFSPDPTSPSLRNSLVLTENLNGGKLFRVCSAPCLTRSWSLDETGKISA